MNRIVITMDNKSDVEALLYQLNEMEEDGKLQDAFNVHVETPYVGRPGYSIEMVSYPGGPGFERTPGGEG
jgi:hypothetical protein